MSNISIYTIGFTKKSAKSFFSKLKASGVHSVIDVRLNNISQLAGFSKRDDLKYFLSEICNISYVHLPILAPTQEMLYAYKKGQESWEIYADRFISLLESRKIEDHISAELVHKGCLLCSEDTPHHCHRRLVAEYLKSKWSAITISHL